MWRPTVPVAPVTRKVIAVSCARLLLREGNYEPMRKDSFRNYEVRGYEVRGYEVRGGEHPDPAAGGPPPGRPYGTYGRLADI
ncbi:hypothetical protein GCM10010140_62730 [Streptosporangium pseudovulgare]|uniref:Uncharacterized protein n=1 Tax=Streptosporangium pseudovulgare TaxID=35765 RepID=A0ABQ2RFW4_9ACTN|nr:hypothetical protein GCM10010140_62730 [Streptosporangium pseudovulgare]